MSHSQEGNASPESLPLSSSVVCFCHHHVTVNVCKAVVGQIWLKDIKFCCYFTWIKVTPKGVWRVLSLLAANMCQLPTNARPWRKLFLHISFYLSLLLQLTEGGCVHVLKIATGGALIIICWAPTAFMSKQRQQVTDTLKSGQIGQLRFSKVYNGGPSDHTETGTEYWTRTCVVPLVALKEYRPSFSEAAKDKKRDGV